MVGLKTSRKRRGESCIGGHELDSESTEKTAGVQNKTVADPETERYAKLYTPVDASQKISGYRVI